MARKARDPKKDLRRIEKAAVRKERVEQGALDGRFREKVVPAKKRPTVRRKRVDPDED
jgi:hypothetical protein